LNENALPLHGVSRFSARLLIGRVGGARKRLRNEPTGQSFEK
jgi:hypothetical protein